MSLIVDIENKLSSFDLKVNINETNKILGFLGASGSGKSMTLKCIAGLVKPAKGKIILNNTTLFDSEKKINLSPQKRRVGYLFQNYALFPHMNVIDNIEVGISSMDKDSKNKLIKNQIEKLNLSGLEKRYPHELSGGQQQRVALARTLVTNPSIILLDEPFSALDVHLKKTIEKDLLYTLNDYNGTVIYVTHDISEAYRICDNIVVFDKGKSLKKRNKFDLFNSPENISEAKLTGCNNIFSARKIDDYTIYVEDFKYEYKTNKIIPSDITNLCIRTHDVNILPSSDYINTHKFKLVNILENPFTYILFLKSPINNSSTLLEVEINKEDMHYQLNSELNIQFKSEDIFYF